MFGIEKQLLEQLLILKEVYNVTGIKAEFEAEGSTYNDLVRLRRLTDKAGLNLILKIGGVEAVRDIKDSIELGVDGIVAPMVETAFGVKKFLSAYKSIYRDNRIKLAINIETRNAIEELDDILDYEGDIKKLGKNTGADKQKNKSTFVSILGIEESKKLQKNIL